MTAITFGSVYATSPRRAAARRARPVPRAVPAAQTPITDVRSAHDVVTSQYKPALIALVVFSVLLHLAIIYAFNRPMEIAPLVKPPVPQLTIDIAPPPPVVEPKPLPKIEKPAPVKAAPVKPSMPVVRNDAPVDNGPPAPDAVPVARAPDPAPPAPAPVEKLTQPRGFAGYLSNPEPKYPLAAQSRGIQGKVVLKVHVLASGKPDNVAVAKSSGYDILDQAAVTAVNVWVFEPAKRGDTPVDGWVNVPLNFKLS